MSNEHENDDEIRESIPCVSFWVPESETYRAHSACLPVGYSLDKHGGVWWRGVDMSSDGLQGTPGAWDHAVAREKARRQREGQVSAEEMVTRERDGLNGVIEGLCDVRDRLRIDLACASSQRDKASSMLAEVIRERDGLHNMLEDERARVIEAQMKCYELRAKLERVRGMQRWDLEFRHYESDEMDMRKADDGDYVAWDDIAAIIGKDGEA